MPRSRALNLLIAIAAGAAFLAGLMLGGTAGGLLLLAVAALLALLSAGAWHQVRRQGRPLRIVVVAAIVAIAAAKLAGAL